MLRASVKEDEIRLERAANRMEVPWRARIADMLPCRWQRSDDEEYGQVRDCSRTQSRQGSVAWTIVLLAVACEHGSPIGGSPQMESVSEVHALFREVECVNKQGRVFHRYAGQSLEGPQCRRDLVSNKAVDAA